MIDYAKRLRAPALIAVLLVVGFYVALAIGYFIILLSHGSAVFAAARMAGAASASLVWVFVVVALALTCVLVRPQARQAAKLIFAAAIVVGVATLVALVFWVIGLFGGFTIGVTLAAVGGLIETLAKAACAIVLWRVRRLVDAEQAIAGPPPQANSDTPAAEVAKPPVWNPAEAVGLQWSRAGDAASGAPADPHASAQPKPQPVRRQLWSRGGVAPEELPPPAPSRF